MCTISLFQISKASLLQKMILLTFKSFTRVPKIIRSKKSCPFVHRGYIMLIGQDVWTRSWNGSKLCYTISLSLCLSLSLSLSFFLLHTHITRERKSNGSLR